MLRCFTFLHPPMSWRFLSSVASYHGGMEWDCTCIMTAYNLIFIIPLWSDFFSLSPRSKSFSPRDLSFHSTSTKAIEILLMLCNERFFLESSFCHSPAEFRKKRWTLLRCCVATAMNIHIRIDNSLSSLSRECRTMAACNYVDGNNSLR